MEDLKHNFDNLELDKNMLKKELELLVVEFEENSFVGFELKETKMKRMKKELKEKELKEEMNLEMKLKSGLFEEKELREKEKFQ